MKTSTYKYILLTGTFAFLIACSTKKDSFVNRNYHAVTTEYNVLYNGNIALVNGVEELKTTYSDNFWELLPVERMQPVAQQEEEQKPAAGRGKAADKEEKQKNPNFDRAEEKATKAIQKHSMYIGGTERNPQMDEAHLLLGKARYYENRFIPALEAFNYILYKYPSSDKIFEAKVWREKTNLRLENEAIAIKNLKKLLEEKEKIEPQIFADANAMLAQAYIAIGSKDSAVVVLKNAAEFTKQREEEARYHFILGQLYESLEYPDSAYAEFQTVIDMKRKSPRMYTIQAHARQAAQFDYKNGDTLVFMEKYRKLLKDRENRPYLDVINHQVGLFYDKQDLDDKAVEYYNKSLRQNPKDKYLAASNHRNIAEINFENAKYPTAGKYYDSTLVFLNQRTREYRAIKKKRDNLDDVIKYEGIAQTNDSILSLAAMTNDQRVAYFEEYIVKLKDADEKEKERLEREAQIAENMNRGQNPQSMLTNSGNLKGGTVNNMGTNTNKLAGQQDYSMVQRVSGKSTGNNTTSGNTQQQYGGGTFYFYNNSIVSYGKLEFQRKWGGRKLADNWRWSSEQRSSRNDEGETINDSTAVASNEDEFNPRYSPEFYIGQLPTSQVVLDSLAKERNFAYYQLGTIYKEKFKEYQRAADKLEKLLTNSPEERLILPSKYNLYKIYQIINPERAELYKNQILNEYPDSRYAEIIRNPGAEQNNNQSPEAVYANLFKQYEDGKLREVYPLVEEAIDTYTGEEIASKFELLKANIVARLKGLEEYKNALNYVALNYPNSEEGKSAEAMLKTNVPTLEKIDFGRPAVSWKIIFKFDSNPDDAKAKELNDKLKKFIEESYNRSLTLSRDVYTMNEDFIVMHGLNSKEAAVDAVSILKDYKEYKITQTPYIISSEDYKVIQIKKNFTQFLAIE
ncbi:tetratricopeptide repeat protein [Flavobacterium rakeshii]|uniref:Tetratricopeptide repeat protein n=1 Tax=Flavobacterium rakeshii TaxID=1038845 RepID=A0A6N8HHP0_9FLAO|nr:tetratricopeptide repeat protein [Flavobacterium rakeshii]MUV05269.1 tetratricopeptide repeat protein [Flavobacterium rakeshii]